MTTSQQKLLPWLSNLVTKTIDQGLPVLPEVLFICRKQFRKSLFVSQGQVSQNHSPFSILFLLCCSLLCSALLCSSVLSSALLCSEDFPDEKCRFPDEKSRFPDEKKKMGMGISPVDSQQGCILLCSMEQLHRLRSPPIGSHARRCAAAFALTGNGSALTYMLN